MAIQWKPINEATPTPVDEQESLLLWVAGYGATFGRVVAVGRDEVLVVHDSLNGDWETTHFAIINEPGSADC